MIIVELGVLREIASPGVYSGPFIALNNGYK